ncbi:MAG: serpin family protein, partial [Armatimonadetes bacterium]|nr:serpin family protein [Armatimonadota bacterium]
MNRFAFDLFARVAAKDSGQNLCVSPASVETALAMTYNGASGKTKEAMAKTLRYGSLSREEVNRASAGMIKVFHDPQIGVELAVGNSLWADRQVAFRPDFLKRARDAYQAQAASLDFQAPDALATMNRWLSDRTQGRITHIVKKEDLRQSVLILMNALYFKGKWGQVKSWERWIDPFNRNSTRNRPFYLLNGNKKSCPMMSGHGEFRHLRTEAFEAVALPYTGGRLSMAVFLPAPQTGLKRFLKSLNESGWNEWMASLYREGGETEGELILPRFQLEYEIELNDALTELGMGIAFNLRKADFREMSDVRLWIGAVRHKTCVEVNEEGTEAAAATIDTMKAMMKAPMPPFSMAVDRPFFYAIRDDPLYGHSDGPGVRGGLPARPSVILPLQFLPECPVEAHQAFGVGAFLDFGQGEAVVADAVHLLEKLAPGVGFVTEFGDMGGADPGLQKVEVLFDGAVLDIVPIGVPADSHLRVAACVHHGLDIGRVGRAVAVNLQPDFDAVIGGELSAPAERLADLLQGRLHRNPFVLLQPVGAHLHPGRPHICGQLDESLAAFDMGFHLGG